jgi:hypothetical protein
VEAAVVEVVEVVEAEDATVVRNFWLDRKKPVDADTTTLLRVGIRRLMLYIERRTHYLWQEDASMYTFSSKVKELLDQLRRRGAFCDYNFICSEKTMVIGIKPNERVPWVYLEQELA